MRVINVSLSELETKMLMIGFEGENQITQVRIDAADILTDYPNATPTLIVKPLFGFAYPVIVTQEGTDVVWEIDNSVLNFHGDGEIQLTFTAGTVIAKSYVGRIRIKRSLTVNGEAPDPIETWEQAATAKLAEVDAQIGELEDMVDAAEAAKDQAQDIVDDAAADIQAAGATQIAAVEAKGEEVKESIPSDYTALTGEVSGLKSAIDSYSIPMNKTGFIMYTDGSIFTNTTGYAYSDFVHCDKESNIAVIDLKVGATPAGIAFYDLDKNYISGINNINGTYIVSSIPENTAFVRFSSAITENNAQAFVGNQVFISKLISDFEATPKNSSFFTKDNWFDPDTAVVYSDKFVNVTGEIRSTTGGKCVSFPVEPSTTYYINIPNSNRCIIAESQTNNFSNGEVKTPLYTSGPQYPVEFITGSNARYVIVYFHSGEYDWNANKNNVVLNKDTYTGKTGRDLYIERKYLPSDVGSTLADAKILIFGDSITDCCNISINASKETTAYTWKDPSNSYTDSQGNVITFSMWPKILKISQPCGEIRNYARSGASYKTSTRPTGEERQNLQYQIDVALNDVDNPNNVFEVDNFIPDIVVFALGTNDGDPNDSFDSAMAKTVLQNDGVSIDVAATIANLDDTKFCESARKAYMRIKQAFPLAQIYVVLPIQRADRDNFGNNRTYLDEMANRYGAIVIDGAGECGITRDFNNWNTLGTYLKDGLHPNEKGQNLMARMIIASLLAHFIPFGTGFNVLT